MMRRAFVYVLLVALVALFACAVYLRAWANASILLMVIGLWLPATREDRR